MKRSLLLVSLALTACVPSFEPSDTPSSDSRLSPSPRSKDLETETVRVRRDAYGVPHIQADSDAAAFYGLGWATAHDRRFQMELAMLKVQGRLAEHFGDLHLDSDRQARLTFAWEAAERRVDPDHGAFDADTLALLQAYADGVNAYTAVHGSPAFDATGITPQTWTPAHTVAAWHHLVAGFSVAPWREAGNRAAFDADVVALGSRKAAIEAWLDAMHPGVPSSGIVQLDDVDPAYVAKVDAFAEAYGFDSSSSFAPSHANAAPAFSHAYAVHPDRTVDGASLLVADPQLPVLLPSVWYEFHLDSPGFRVRGVGVPGSPGIAVGMTEGVAWGITSGGGDQADLYRLTPGKTDDTYVIGGVDQAMVVETTTIRIDDGAGGTTSETLERRWTRFGPDVTAIVDDGHTYALRSVLYDETDRSTLVGMLDMMRADDLDDLKGALDDWRAPVVNLIAADHDDIYYSLVGGIPVRSERAALGGYIAQDASEWTDNWRTTIPHSVLPQVTSPAAGVVYSANHRPVGDWYPLPLAQPVNAKGHTVRSARLRDLLGTSGKISFSELVTRVQGDCVDHNRQRVVALGNRLRDRGYTGFSTKAEATLLDLRDWARDGGSMLDDEPDAYVALAIPTSFRTDATGPALQETYYGGEGGMTFFLDTVEQRLDDDPAYLPDKEELAYLNGIFEDAASRVSLSDTEREAAWDAFQEVTLDLHDTFNGPAPDLGHSVDATLQCSVKSTIWSQPSQSYTMEVDFGGGAHGSLLPVGTSERRDHPWHTAELANWESHSPKPAPVDPDDVDAILDDTRTVELEVVLSE